MYVYIDERTTFFRSTLDANTSALWSAPFTTPYRDTPSYSLCHSWPSERTHSVGLDLCVTLDNRVLQATDSSWLKVIIETWWRDHFLFDGRYRNEKDIRKTDEFSIEIVVNSFVSVDFLGMHVPHEEAQIQRSRYNWTNLEWYSNIRSRPQQFRNET